MEKSFVESYIFGLNKKKIEIEIKSIGNKKSKY